MSQGRTRITIRDVAKQAHVSPATVSLVLNNAPGVSSATREHVRRIVRASGYKPDAVAQSFSSTRAETVALVMPPGMESFHDPYFMSLMKGVLEAVRDKGWQMLLEIADERFMRQRLWDDLFQHKRIDGVIIATPQLDHRYVPELAHGDLPALLINGARPDVPELDFWGYDDVRCGQDATRYLLGLGHRRIGHLAGPDNQASALDRLHGYRLALEAAGIAPRPEDVLFCDYRAASAARAMETLLTRPASDRPTALFCGNDTTAIVAMQVAQHQGLSIPSNLSIIGVDDTGAAEQALPPLTTLRQDIYGLSRDAAARFLTKLDENTNEPLHVCLTMPLIERQSCAPYAALA